MDRISAENYVTVDGKRMFSDGNPHKAEAEEATVLNAEWLNSVQEEICGFIESQDIPLAKDNNSGLQKAIVAAIEAALRPERERITKIMKVIGMGV